MEREYFFAIPEFITGHCGKEHIASGKLPLDGSVFDYMPADGRSASRTRRAHEQRSIKKHAPPGNKSRGGEGRPARRRKSGASKPHDRSPSPQKAPGGCFCMRAGEACTPEP